MPAPVAHASTSTAQAGAIGIVNDIYLTAKSARAGTLQGESITPGHLNEIIVHGWSWGLQTTSDAATGLATGRRRLQEMVVRKTTDRSTTQLLAAINNNDILKEVKLTMRKSGGVEGDFLTLTLKDARVTALNYETDATGSVQEVIHLGFQSLEFVLRPQLASGALGPTMSQVLDNPIA